MDGEPVNRRDGLRAVAVGGVAAMAVAGSPAGAAEDIAPNKLPANIRAAADRLFKGAKWSSAMKNKEDGEDVYELFGEDAKGMSLSMEIGHDGKVTSAEKEIDVKQVPKVVMDTLAGKMPKFHVENAMIMYHGDDIHDLSKAEVTYQLNGPAAKGKDVTVEITAEGKFIETKREIEVSDVPKLVTDSLTAKAPRFRIETAHTVRREGTLVYYILKGAGGRIATVTPDGKEVEIHRDQ